MGKIHNNDSYSLCTDDTFTFTGSSDPNRHYTFYRLVDSIQMFFHYLESVAWKIFTTIFRSFFIYSLFLLCMNWMLYPPKCIYTWEAYSEYESCATLNTRRR